MLLDNGGAGRGTFAERRLTKVEQVQTRGRGGPNFGHFVRTYILHIFLFIYFFHVHKACLGENTPWNISFRALHEIRISQQFHCVNITEKCSWYPFWSLTWNMKILKIDFQNFLYHERLFYWICFYAWLLLLLSMMSKGKFKGKWKHKAKSKHKMVFPILY